MTRKRRSVDVLAVKMSFAEMVASSLKFEDILRYINGERYYSAENGKHVELILICPSNSDTLIRGLVITTQDSDIPPKRNKHTGEMSSLDINVEDEGFAYANAFLYDTQRNVLLYEINKNGCYLNLLKEYFYNTWNSTSDPTLLKPKFNIDFLVVARRDEYRRMLSMSYYKELVVELSRPTELIQAFAAENDLMSNWIKVCLENASAGNADSVSLSQAVISRKMNNGGLSRAYVKLLIDTIMQKVGKANIQKLQVKGYTEDPEDSSRCKPVNLLADVFDEYFYITSKQLHSDVQMQERLKGIESVHSKILPELNDIFGTR